MSINRFARKADKATQAIVDELRALGYSVTYLGLPVDLAVHRESWGANAFRFLEVKSARKKRSGEVVLDARQKKQADFCAQHGVPYVTNTLEALKAMGEIA
jgi:hypothetical protein